MKRILVALLVALPLCLQAGIDQEFSEKVEGSYVLVGESCAPFLPEEVRVSSSEAVLAVTDAKNPDLAVVLFEHVNQGVIRDNFTSGARELTETTFKDNTLKKWKQFCRGTVMGVGVQCNFWRVDSSLKPLDGGYSYFIKITVSGYLKNKRERLECFYHKVE